jgi:hypothetical protein
MRQYLDAITGNFAAGAALFALRLSQFGISFQRSNLSFLSRLSGVCHRSTTAAPAAVSRPAKPARGRRHRGQKDVFGTGVQTDRLRARSTKTGIIGCQLGEARKGRDVSRRAHERSVPAGRRGSLSQSCILIPRPALITSPIADHQGGVGVRSPSRIPGSPPLAAGRIVERWRLTADL